MCQSQDSSLFVFLCVVSGQQSKVIIVTQETAIGQKSHHFFFLAVDLTEQTLLVCKSQIVLILLISTLGGIQQLDTMRVSENMAGTIQLNFIDEL